MEQVYPKKCSDCNRELEEGKDILELRTGVLGLRGFVPLEDELVFCSEECLREHVDVAKDDLLKFPKRVP